MNEDDDRCPLSADHQPHIGSSKKCTLFLAPSLNRGKSCHHNDRQTTSASTKRDCHKHLAPLDLALSSSGPRNEPFNFVKLCRQSSTPSSSSTHSFNSSPPTREKRSQSVPLVKFKLRLGAGDGQPSRSVAHRHLPPSHAGSHNSPIAYYNSICDCAADRRRTQHLALVVEANENGRPVPAVHNQESQTDVIVTLDDLLPMYEIIPPEDQSTQTYSEERDAVSVTTSTTSSIRKSSRFPWYQRKLISLGLSEILVTNLIHPLRAFKRYPGFSREELLGLQCVLYIWGFLLVSVCVAFYFVV